MDKLIEDEEKIFESIGECHQPRKDHVTIVWKLSPIQKLGNISLNRKMFLE